MSNRDERNARLVAETFHERWTDGPAAGFAREAAHHARQRRARRRTLGTAGVVAGFAAVFFFLTRPHPVSAPETRPLQTTAAGRGYEIISDDELLAEIRDRPLLVVTKDSGARQVIVLEAGSDE